MPRSAIDQRPIFHRMLQRGRNGGPINHG
jgi:hypothetical protein